jgi:undecaprenyl-diphosphatase
MWAQLAEWDRAVFRVLNAGHAPWLDGPMFLLTQAWAWVPLYGLLLWLIWQKMGLRSWHFLLLVGLAITLSDQTASGLLKPLVQRVRPCNEPLVAPVHIVNGYCSQAWSFASSHAANSATVALLCGLMLAPGRRWLWVLLGLYWALHSYSRIYLGVHYPGDIVGGTLIGALWATVLWQGYRKVLPSQNLT